MKVFVNKLKDIASYPFFLLVRAGGVIKGKEPMVIVREAAELHFQLVGKHRLLLLLCYTAETSDVNK